MCGFQPCLHGVYRQGDSRALVHFCNIRHRIQETADTQHRRKRALKGIGKEYRLSNAANASHARRGAMRLTAHALGNVLMGMAVGLLSYYLITDVVTRREQAELQESFAQLRATAVLQPDRLVEEPELTGWETWMEEDVAYWRELSDGDVFGRLVIEAMDLDVVVVRGTTRETLKLGPGWIPYTDVPAQSGNVGIAGHRTTYGAPFRRLDELGIGDTVTFYSPFRSYTYAVVEILTVTPDQVEVVRSTEDPRLTLTACHPPYSAQYRLIVQSKLIDMQRLEEADGAAAP